MGFIVNFQEKSRRPRISGGTIKYSSEIDFIVVCGDCKKELPLDSVLRYKDDVDVICFCGHEININSSLGR